MLRPRQSLRKEKLKQRFDAKGLKRFSSEQQAGVGAHRCSHTRSRFSSHSYIAVDFSNDLSITQWPSPPLLHMIKKKYHSFQKYVVGYPTTSAHVLPKCYRIVPHLRIADICEQPPWSFLASLSLYAPSAGQGLRDQPSRICGGRGNLGKGGS